MAAKTITQLYTDNPVAAVGMNGTEKLEIVDQAGASGASLLSQIRAFFMTGGGTFSGSYVFDATVTTTAGGFVAAAALIAGNGGTGSITCTTEGNASIVRNISYRTSAAAHATFIGDAVSGTIAAPGYLANNALALEMTARTWNGAIINGQTIGRFAFRTTEAHAVAAFGTAFTCELVANGSTTNSEAFRIDWQSGLQLYGSGNTVIDANRHLRLRSYTVGTLPLASAAAGQKIYCSDLGGGGGELVSNGTNWLRSQEGYSTVSTDADFTLTPLTSAENIRHTGTLTANRAVTLSTSGAYAGAKFRITRTGAGAFNLNVGTGPLKALIQNTWAEFTYDGSAWYLSEYGAL